MQQKTLYKAASEFKKPIFYLCCKDQRFIIKVTAIALLICTKFVEADTI